MAITFNVHFQIRRQSVTDGQTHPFISSSVDSELGKTLGAKLGRGGGELNENDKFSSCDHADH